MQFPNHVKTSLENVLNNILYDAMEVCVWGGGGSKHVINKYKQQNVLDVICVCVCDSVLIASSTVCQFQRLLQAIK